MKSFLGRWWTAALLIFLLFYSCDGHQEIRKLRKEVRELQGASVRLTPGSDGYQVIRHHLGSATLNLKEIKAHASGSVITLEIGNPSSFDIAGATMTIAYPIDYVEHSSKYDVQQTLEAGKETKALLILKGAKPAGITYIFVSNFQPKGIRLIGANKVP